MPEWVIILAPLHFAEGAVYLMDYYIVDAILLVGAIQESPLPPDITTIKCTRL